jgi:hypothetical protein
LTRSSPYHHRSRTSPRSVAGRIHAKRSDRWGLLVLHHNRGVGCGGCVWHRALNIYRLVCFDAPQSFPLILCDARRSLFHCCIHKKTYHHFLLRFFFFLHQIAKCSVCGNCGRHELTYVVFVHFLEPSFDGTLFTNCCCVVVVLHVMDFVSLLTLRGNLAVF